MKEKIYFIPGTMCDVRLWDDLWPKLETALGDNYQLMHVPIPKEKTLTEILSAFYRIFNDFGDNFDDDHNYDLADEKVNLVGFSLGGYLASAFNAAYPDKVKRLFIASNTPCILPEEEILTRKKIIKWVEKNGYSGLPSQRASDLLHPDNKQNKAIIDKMIVMDKTLGQEVLLQQFKVTTKREDLFTGLLNAAIPITFCSGVEDSLVNSALFYKIPANHSLIQHIEIPDAGHMLPLEQPEAMAKAILLWLEK